MLFFVLIIFSIFDLTVAKDECQPATWSNTNAARDELIRWTRGVFARANDTGIINIDDNIVAGEINCRYSSTTTSDVNYYTCTKLANRYGVTIEKFFELNPNLTLNCDNIQPNTEYYVAGCKF